MDKGRIWELIFTRDLHLLIMVGNLLKKVIEIHWIGEGNDQSYRIARESKVMLS